MNTSAAHPARGSVAVTFVVAALLAAAIVSYALLISSVASTLAGAHSSNAFASWTGAFAEPR